MCVCPCSCVFGADFEQICIAEIEILCVKSLVFHGSIDVKFYDFYSCQNASMSVFIKISFIELCNSKLHGLHAFDNMV